MNKQLLIDAVSSLPELYDKSHKNYGNIDHRNQVWETLAEKFGLTAVDIRNKWRNIRDAYQKALKKKADCFDNNTMEFYKAYKYEDQLIFLKNFCSASVKGVKRKSSSRFERLKLKQNKLGFILNTANGEYIQDIYEDEEDSKAILESHLQDEPEEIFNCVELEEQKEYEQSIETQSNFKAELIYEEINIEAECEENSNQDGTIESETTICTNNNPVSVCKEADEMSKKIMSDFFLTVCNTVSTLPMLLQAKIKKQVFDIVSEAEISHLTEQLIHK